MRKIALAALMVFFWAGLNAYGGSGVTISKSEFGSKWPFTVSSGILNCDGQGITFTANGKTYAVNGTAQSMGYSKINEIWKDDQAMADVLKKLYPGEDVGPIPKISIGPIINRGRALCGW